MTELEFHHYLLQGWFILAGVVFVALQFIVAPYGRHRRPGWGPVVPARLGWIVMELPPVVLVGGLFLVSDRRSSLVAGIFLAMWQIHYVYRAFIYPLRQRAPRPIPVAIVALGFITNLGIDYLNARWLFTLGPERDPSWLTSFPFLAGVSLFMVGFGLNLHSDGILRRLRSESSDGYRIPHGGGFRFISSPNYLGEIIEWSGWALATMSLPGLAFAVWTASNLVPRAMAHHRWYHTEFSEYPAERRALIPYVL